MQELENALKKSLEVAFPEADFSATPVEITPAPEATGADFATNLPLRLAKTLHQPPLKIAEQIAAHFPESAGRLEIAPPGFLNIISPDEYFLSKIRQIRKSPTSFRDFIALNEYQNKTVVCEFSDPNPFKVLHVGHLYTSVVGDSLARLYECAGAKVARTNFGGDVGLHVAKTLYALQESTKDLPFEKVLEDLTVEQIAKNYVEGTKAYDEDPAAHSKITDLNRQIYEISTEGQHDSDLAKLYWHGREISYAYFKDFYHSIGVQFDKFYPESTVAPRGLAKVREELKNGVYEESDGAVIYRGEKLGLHTRVFINKNGLPTYESKDVGLIFTKWDDYHFDESVIITANDIVDYMQVVLASIHEYAPELADRTRHITHSNIKLPGAVKMSSRKGNFLKAVDVIGLVRDELAREYGSVDEKVLLGAIKYTFLKYKIGGGDISLDVKKSIEKTGNSGPYLQYAAVRAKKILKKCTKDPSFDFDAITGTLEPAEKALAKKTAAYPEILSVTLAERAPHKLCAYLYELAQTFSRFYESSPVAGSDRESLRAELVAAYLDVLTHGLDLLGIEIPEEM